MRGGGGGGAKADWKFGRAFLAAISDSYEEVNTHLLSPPPTQMNLLLLKALSLVVNLMFSHRSCIDVYIRYRILLI